MKSGKCKKECLAETDKTKTNEKSEDEDIE